MKVKINLIFVLERAVVWTSILPQQIINKANGVI